MGSSSSKLEAAKKANEAVGSLGGRFALVVGGTSGIGQALALRLAQSGASVVICGRNERVGGEMIIRMRECAPAGAHGFLQCDASLMANVRATAAQYAEAYPRLDFLILCQTKSTMQGRTPTAEGLDEKLALNYYSRIQFIQSFLGLLDSTASAGGDVRVMSVLSAGVHSPYKSYREDPDLHDFSLKKAADAAGFYTDLAFDQLARQHAACTFVHAAPGFVNTNWGSDFPPFLKGCIRCMQASPMSKSSEECAEFLLQPLVAPQQRGGLRLVGEYGQEVEKTALHTDEAREFVWEHTSKALAGTQ